MKKNDSTAPLSLPVFRQISAIAARQDVPAFVVGGYVRDFYLGRPSTDIDVVVVGSGIALAEALGSESIIVPNISLADSITDGIWREVQMKG